MSFPSILVSTKRKEEKNRTFISVHNGEIAEIAFIVSN